MPGLRHPGALLAPGDGRGRVLPDASTSPANTRRDGTRAGCRRLTGRVVRGPIAVDLSSLREVAPRSFAILHEIPADDDGPVVLTVAGWGLQLTDRAVFVWCDAQSTDNKSVGMFTSADHALLTVEIIGPARLVWMAPSEPGA